MSTRIVADGGRPPDAAEKGAGSDPVVLAIDIGGTKMAAGVVGPDGELLGECRGTDPPRR